MPRAGPCRPVGSAAVDDVTRAARAYVGVEMGGTKCVCLRGTGPEDIRDRATIPTADPQTTLAAIGTVLDGWRATHGAPAAIGVASFGPLHLEPGEPRYGQIGTTPKPGWAGVDLASFYRARARAPLGLTTDVNGAALAEGRWGSARGLADFAYVTVGTGVGVGLIVGGRYALGARHPELGHVRIARLPGDTWPGVCRFHGDCVEGLASGPAIQARSGVDPAELPPDSPIWNPVAHALAQLAHVLVVSVAPRRILIGGGVVAGQRHLFQRVRRLLTQSLNGYIDSAELAAGLDEFIVPPGLGTLAGPLGALALAADAYATEPVDKAQ